MLAEFPARAACLLRVASAIGVSQFYFYSEDGRIRSSYDDNDYLILDPATGANRVDNMVYTWQHENDEVPSENGELCPSIT